MAACPKVQTAPHIGSPSWSCCWCPEGIPSSWDTNATKLHIVFDGSTKADKNVSLNDCLSKGPNHTPYTGRFYQAGLVADDKKVFHQILINITDCDMLWFLWFECVNAVQLKILQYRFCQLPFGQNLVLQFLMLFYRNTLSIAKPQSHMYTSCCLKLFYMDDFVSDITNNKVGSMCIKLHNKFWRKGGLNLWKWHMH